LFPRSVSENVKFCTAARTTCWCDQGSLVPSAAKLGSVGSANAEVLGQPLHSSSAEQNAILSLVKHLGPKLRLLSSDTSELFFLCNCSRAHGIMNVHPDEMASKRRKIRKGTHSCWECRRRKVKCTFASEEDAVCVMCHRRDTECASQIGFGGLDTIEGSTGYRERLVVSQPAGVMGGSDQPELQDAIESYPQSTRFPTSLTPALTPHGNSVANCKCQPLNHHVNQSANKESIPNHTHGRRTEQTPFLHMTPDLPPTPASSHISPAELNTNPKITHGLLLSLPPRGDIELLLVKVGRISTLCHQASYRTRNSNVKDMSEVEISISNLLCPHAHPVLLARQMLLFAAALQYLSPDEVVPGLTKHHHQIMEEMAESAIAMVTTNDALLGTLEGLEAITLEVRYHVDSGNIRRAWITLRRAVMAAQLLGLHRPGHYRFKLIDDTDDMIPEVMWASIVSMERGLSLLLGLPTSTGDKSCAIQEPTDDSNHERNLSMLTTAVTAKILERNQILPSQQAFEMTREIDRELVKITDQMPSIFWRPPMFAGLQLNSMNAFVEAGRNWEHIWYYSLVNQLHLPYMMCADNVPQNIYSRVACVNASREILSREIAIRSFNPISAYCRIGDFMALVAGMTLILAHIVSHCRKEQDNMLVHQRLSDRATVEQALECMKSMSALRKDVLTTKCAALLNDLLAVEEDAAQGQSHRNVLVIQVPFVGPIRIAPEGITPVVPSRMAQNQDVYEGVTIGGIGSFHLNSSRRPEYCSNEGTADVAAAPAATTHSTNASSTQQHAAHSTPIAPGDLYMHQDQMFPDAAASMDDWVFQGLDTAFFDVLMRGVGDQQLNGAGAEVWDV
jgi:hypothetical protein